MMQDRNISRSPSKKAQAELRAEGVFDLIVIGAGINGLGIARDAAARGLRVAVVEKEDIGSGCSSWSGRLIHGGLRYLEQGDVALVRESLRERELLFRLAPHLVKPVPLMMPVYKHSRRPKWMIRAAMIAYDILSFDKSTVWHRTLSRKDTLKRFPKMSDDGLQGSAVFMDGQVVWTERLCAEVTLAAHGEGAEIYTHSKVDGFIEEGGRIAGVMFTDELDETRHALRASLVVNASGPWVDYVLGDRRPDERRHIGGAKGSHLIVAPFPGAPSDVVYYESRADGRLVLIIPWGDYIMIGTTDKKFDEDPDLARADQSEMDYLLGEVNQLIPTANLSPSDVLYTYSGVRPLPYVPDTGEWNVPRSHVIFDHAPARSGLLSIIGGKLSTYRSLAEDAVDEIFKQLGKKTPACTTRKIKFPGARVADFESYKAELSKTFGVASSLSERLVSIYGARAGDILALGNSQPELMNVLDPESGAIAAELVFTFENEFCRTLTDALIRRVMVGLNGSCGREVLDEAADILAGRAGWSEARKQAEKEDYLQYIKRFDVPGVVRQSTDQTSKSQLEEADSSALINSQLEKI